MKKTTEKGYGAAHQAERRKWQAKINLGSVPCSRCQEPVTASDPWELDHDDTKQGYLGPAHTTCNRAAGGRKSRALQLAVNNMTVRDW